MSYKIRETTSLLESATDQSNQRYATASSVANPQLVGTFGQCGRSGLLVPAVVGWEPKRAIAFVCSKQAKVLQLPVKFAQVSH